ncbi:MAG: tetratricopeptide repeat protein [Alphaproteobacteria bacterium]|nr:tetratricopeptide repeat protein [Alphaproteobacteria bacterium]MCB9698297.1 tetratricopeptide repeat protein [Alphaproteobacteria bacterium]
MVGPAIWWLVTAAIADPGDAPDTPSTGPVAVEEGEPTPAPVPAAPPDDPNLLPFGDVLHRAEQWYFAGRVEEARSWLEALQLRVLAGEPDLRWDEVVEALTYLGEIQYDQGEPDTARMTFRWVLEQDVETPISPYHHPLEVVNLFELVRATVKAERVDTTTPITPPPRPPTPPWVLLPFGAPQFVQHRNAAGALYLGSQAALATTSIVTWFQLAHATNTPVTDETPEERTNRQLKRYAIQWPSTIGFYTLWAVSSIDASRWHHRHPPIEVGLSVGPQPGVVVGGRF